MSDLEALPGGVARPFSVATSEAGNDIAAVNVSSAPVGKPRALVWFQARQHAWESGSSWVADGVARYAASDAGSALRSLADVVVTPIIDVDNVAMGGVILDLGLILKVIISTHVSVSPTPLHVCRVLCSSHSAHAHPGLQCVLLAPIIGVWLT